MEQHRSYRILNKQLQFLGCGRKTFFGGMLAGLATLNLAHSVMLAAAVFGVAVFIGRWLLNNGVEARLILYPQWRRGHYDAAVSKPFTLEITR